VNKVLQFARVKIETWKILIPVVCLFLASLITLVCWTVLVDYGWTRGVVDDFTGESYGNCGSKDGEDRGWGLLAATLITAGLPVVCGLAMAWRTKDVEDSFSESWWIFSMVFVQLQVR
jgi:hypothetical protein